MAIQIQAIKRRAFLRQMAEQAKRTASTLKETLVAAQGGQFVSTFAKGRLVVSQSGSGQSGSFQMEVAGSEWTQSNIFGLIEELIELCEYVCTAQALTDDASPANTDAIFQAMIADVSMNPSRVQYGDYTLIGVPNSYGYR
jgi:hypothetical protein